MIRNVLTGFALGALALFASTVVAVAQSDEQRFAETFTIRVAVHDTNRTSGGNCSERGRRMMSAAASTAPSIIGSYVQQGLPGAELTFFGSKIVDGSFGCTSGKEGRNRRHGVIGLADATVRVSYSGDFSLFEEVPAAVEASSSDKHSEGNCGDRKAVNGGPTIDDAYRKIISALEASEDIEDYLITSVSFSYDALDCVSFKEGDGRRTEVSGTFDYTALVRFR